MNANSRINPWVVVSLCFVTLAIVLSARQSVAIMTGEWVRDLGWSKTFIGSGQSTALVVIGLVAPVTGNYVDRHGVRALLAGGLLVVATGLVLFAIFPIAAVYILGYGLVGASALPPATTM